MSAPAKTEVRLTGLDGSNPLAFMAALGILRLLHYRSPCDQAPRLSWRDEGQPVPVIHGMESLDVLIQVILEDKESWADDPAFNLAYSDEDGQLVDPRKPTAGEHTRDLKPKPQVLRQFLEGLADLACTASGGADRAAGLNLRKSLETSAAYGSELIQDNNGNTKPTALHFTAGQQCFLAQVAGLQAGVAAEDLREALEGPWRRTSLLPNMGWDSTNARAYALRATNPAGDKKATIAGADWLAFIGLGALPSFPAGGKLLTTGVRGGWKDSVFTWPLWDRPAGYASAKSLARTPLESLRQPELRRARGIFAVYSAKILRSDQGGYGSFSPSALQ